jgi:hypothetical protein
VFDESRLLFVVLDMSKTGANLNITYAISAREYGFS